MLQSGEAQLLFFILLFDGQLAPGLKAQQPHIALAVPLEDVHGGRLRIPMPFQQEFCSPVAVDVFHA